MKTYGNWAPTPFDTKGLHLTDGEDRDDWLVAPIILTRDSDALSRSNWRVVLAALQRAAGESEDIEVHRFGHWGCGWLEICLIRPGTTAQKEADRWKRKLEDYPIASEDDLSREEAEEADLTWKNCYDSLQRLEYIRTHQSDFYFHNWKDLLGCVRGKWFCGNASEMCR